MYFLCQLIFLVFCSNVILRFIDAFNNHIKKTIIHQVLAALLQISSALGVGAALIPLISCPVLPRSDVGCEIDNGSTLKFFSQATVFSSTIPVAWSMVIEVFPLVYMSTFSPVMFKCVWNVKPVTIEKYLLQCILTCTMWLSSVQQLHQVHLVIVPLTCLDNGLRRFRCY